MAAALDWDRRVKDAEDNLHAKSEMMGKLKIEFDNNLNKLSDSYYPRMRPLREQVYRSLQYRYYIEKQIQWNEKLLEAMVQAGGEEEFDELLMMQQEREDELSLILPKFQDAIRSLETLTIQDMQVLRRYEHPPQLVIETMENVMILRGEFECSWEECKVMLSDTYFFHFFITRAKNYDKDNVPDEVMDKLEKSMLNPDFEPRVVSQASVPCGALCKWVRAIYEYARVKRIVDDHEEIITEPYLRGEIERLKGELHLNKEEVASAEQKLVTLQLEFEQRKKDIKARYDRTMDPLQEVFFEAHQQYGAAVTSPRRTV